MNNFENLKKWCDLHYEKTNIRLQPQNIPSEILIDEILGRLDSLKNYHDNLVSIYHSINERVTAIEEKLTNQSQKVDKSAAKKEVKK